MIRNTADAVKVIGGNRNYAVCYKQKWRGVINLYDDVRTKVGGPG